MSERCGARVTDMSSGSPSNVECKYPDGECLLKVIESGKLVLRKDELCLGPCPREVEEAFAHFILIAGLGLKGPLDDDFITWDNI